MNKDRKLFFGHTLPAIKNVWFDNERVYFEFANKRVAGAPLAWYPRLQKASISQRNNFEISPSGHGVHWVELDEDLSGEGMLSFGE